MKAFPSNGFYEKTSSGEQPKKIEPIMGMDLHDCFAMFAMMGLICCSNGKFDMDAVAISAFKQADAMMEARKPEEDGIVSIPKRTKK